MLRLLFCCDALKEKGRECARACDKGLVLLGAGPDRQVQVREREDRGIIMNRGLEVRCNREKGGASMTKKAMNWLICCEMLLIMILR